MCHCNERQGNGQIEKKFQSVVLDGFAIKIKINVVTKYHTIIDFQHQQVNVNKKNLNKHQLLINEQT